MECSVASGFGGEIMVWGGYGRDPGTLPYNRKRARCLLPAGKGSRHRLWRQLWLPSGSGISLLFSASPLPCSSNSAPAFPGPHLPVAPSPNSWSLVIGGCLLQGRLAL